MSTWKYFVDEGQGSNLKSPYQSSYLSIHLLLVRTNLVAIYKHQTIFTKQTSWHVIKLNYKVTKLFVVNERNYQKI